MTGFLNLELLWAHAAPRDRWPDRARGMSGHSSLVARWACASDGGFVCRCRIASGSRRFSGGCAFMARSCLL